MHRRITMSFEFRKPDHVQVSRHMRAALSCMRAPQSGLVSVRPGLTRVLGVHPQRQQIWRRQLPAKVKLEEDVDITALALKFELSGGYIRNALQAALIRWVPAVAHRRRRDSLTHPDQELDTLQAQSADNHPTLCT